MIMRHRFRMGFVLLCFTASSLLFASTISRREKFKICATEKKLCSLAKRLHRVGLKKRGAKNQKLREMELQGVVDAVRFALHSARNARRENSRSSRNARILSRSLFSLGLPLEAAIVADRFSASSSRSTAKAVLFYLTMAGDYPAALRYQSRKKRRFNDLDEIQRIDWLMMKGDYAGAASRMVRWKHSSRLSPALNRFKDYWSGQSYHPARLRLRLAALFYLAGNKARAIGALERMSSSKEMLPEKEPLSLSARLLMARIVMADNPRLARKIAIDVSYIAQEKDWQLLEYRATILAGWAHYFLKSDYQAVIQFTKAAGILPARMRQYRNEDSRLLGILAAGNRMRPRRNRIGLIRKLAASFLSTPENRAKLLLQKNLPPGVDTEFFLRQATSNFKARGKMWMALQLRLAFWKRSQDIFTAGKNPGGIRGLASAEFTAAENLKFPYWKNAAIRYGSLLPTHYFPNLVRFPGAGYFSSGKLNRKRAYVFNFAAGKGREIFLLIPDTKRILLNVRYKRRRRKKKKVYRRIPVWTIITMRLDAVRTRYVRRHCAGRGGSFCRKLQKKFRSMSVALQRAGIKKIRVQYDATYDVRYNDLMGPAYRRADLAYFYSPFPGGRALSSFVIRRFYAGASCAGDLAVALRTKPADFRRVFLKGRADSSSLWLWPDKTDRNINRPAYLRRFRCGRESLLFWEMDRNASGSSPAIVAYRSRPGESSLNRAFVRHFAEKGVLLLEWSPGSGLRSAARALGPCMQASPRDSCVQQLLVHPPRGNMARIILPSIFH